MKRLKNVFSGIISLVLVLFFLIYLVFSGGLTVLLRNITVTGCLINIPGGVFSSPLKDISIKKAVSAGAFPAYQYSETDAYAFILPNQGFNTPYFSDEFKIAKYPVTTVTLAPASSSGYLTCKNLLIKDSSTKKPDINEIFKRELDLGLKSSDSGPQVLILHTHATESFNLEGLNTYNKNTPFRSEDISKSIVAVGDVVEEALKQNNINVIHSKELHDKGSYNGSYERSLVTAEKYLKDYPTIKVILDIHRDSIITDKGVNYRPVMQIDNKDAAQVMFVIGTGTDKLKNDNWKNNLRIAAAVGERIEGLYPGLLRPVLLRDSRYNMHLSKGYMLIEIGSCGNTLEEAKRAAEIVGKAVSEELNDIIKQGK